MSNYTSVSKAFDKVDHGIWDHWLTLGLSLIIIKVLAFTYTCFLDII